MGALTYFVLDRLVERRGSGNGAGPALALGAFLDGIPEQAVLGIGLASGEGVSVSLLAAIFVSNLPEAIGSASDMRAAGTRPAAIRRLSPPLVCTLGHFPPPPFFFFHDPRLWIAVALVCTLASVAGYAIADTAIGRPQGGHQRLRRGRPAGHAHRLDDPRGREEGRRRRRPRHRARLRRRHRPLGAPQLVGLRARDGRFGQHAQRLVEVVRP